MADSENPTISPLRALSQSRFGGPTYAVERVVTIPLTRITLLVNNPNRVYWMVINEGLNDVRVTIDPAISATSGWLLPAAGGVLLSDWEDEGEIVGYEVYAIANVAASTVRVREVIRL